MVVHENTYHFHIESLGATRVNDTMINQNLLNDIKPIKKLDD